MAKKKTGNEELLNELLAKYWLLIAQENIPRTPKITKSLDELEQKIKELKG